jgi:hypothetical protein
MFEANSFSIPLSFNFITLLDQKVSRSVFSAYLGASINLTDVGKHFNNWFPLFILIPVLATSFNLYDRIHSALHFTGADWLMDEDDTETRGESLAVLEGRALIGRELGGESGRGTARSRRALHRPLAAVDIDDRQSFDSDDINHSFAHRAWNTVSSGFDLLRPSMEDNGDAPRGGGGVSDTASRIKSWFR